jgi:hypothetical protein
VVLHHVADRAGLLVGRAAAFHAHRLGGGDLDVVDGVAAPHAVEDRVGEPQDEQVLDRLLAEVVVDAEHLRLVEHLVDEAVQLPGAGQVRPERLFEDDAVPLLGPPVPDQGDQVGEGGRRRGAVVQPAALGAPVGVEALQQLVQPPEGIGVVEDAGLVEEGIGEGFPQLLVERCPGERLDGLPGEVPELVVVPFRRGVPDHGVALRQEPAAGEVVQGGDEHPPGEIAGSAEHDDGLRRRNGDAHFAASGCRAFFPPRAVMILMAEPSSPSR